MGRRANLLGTRILRPRALHFDRPDHRVAAPAVIRLSALRTRCELAAIGVRAGVRRETDDLVIVPRASTLSRALDRRVRGWPADGSRSSHVCEPGFAAFAIEYDHPRGLATIEDRPGEVVADYARLVELLAKHGPANGMPHSRALGQGLFEVRPRTRSGTGRALYCFVQDRRIVIVHAYLKQTHDTTSPSRASSAYSRMCQDIGAPTRHLSRHRKPPTA